MKLRYLGTLAAGIILAAACGPQAATTRPTGAGGTAPAGTAPAGTTPTRTGAAPTGTAPSGTAPSETDEASLPPGATPGPTQPIVVTIGVDLPLSGASVANGQPTLNGILIAVQEWNATNPGYIVETNVQDDAFNGVHDPQTGANNVNTLVADPTVVGMIGPFNSNVARAQIPITNEFGLAQCSPANTAVDLTKEGSEVHRPTNPDRRNYFRVATPDDVQGPAGAAFAYDDLEARNALVIDDTEAFGAGVANSFEAEFTRLGGTIAQRVGNDFDTNQSFSAILTGAPAGFDVVYFGGTQVTGGGQLRRDMGAAGMLDIPMVGPDGITDLGRGGDTGAFITLAGVENSDNVFGTIAGANALELETAAEFNEAYEASFARPPGAYSALAYACAQILLQAIDANIDLVGDTDAMREAIRSSIIGTDNLWDTKVLGELSFDENGDSTQKWISFYETDPTLFEGAGGWSFLKQQNFAEDGGTPGASPGASPSST